MFPSIQLEWASNTCKWNYWKHWFSQQCTEHITPGDDLRFTNYNLALQAAIAGQGFIIGSTPILYDLVEANLLENRFPDGVITDIGYDLAATKTAQSRPKVATFINWIKNEARSGAAHKPDLISVSPG